MAASTHYSTRPATAPTSNPENILGQHVSSAALSAFYEVVNDQNRLVATLGERASVRNADLVVDVRDRAAPTVDRRPQITVVVPARDDMEPLQHVVPLIPGSVDETIVVDHGESASAAQALADIAPTVRVLHRPGGRVNALRDGFAAASGSFIVALSGDGSADPREIPAFVGALSAGADLAHGTRFRQGGGSLDRTGWSMRMANRCLQSMVNRLHGGSFTDLACGYFAVRASVVPDLLTAYDGGKNSDADTFLPVRALRMGMQIREVPTCECLRPGAATGTGRRERDGQRAILRELRARYR